MKEKKIIMVGSKSPVDSAFAVFEHFQDWTMLRKSKVLPERAYFAVVLLDKKEKADIAPDIFVQGYRPHSSGKQISVDKRRYGRFITEGSAKEFSDDIIFTASQLYQIQGEREVKLVLRQNESYQQNRIDELIEQICADRQYTRLGKTEKYNYCCKKSAGYFLDGRNYLVWAVMIGENQGFSLQKKVLILDYFTGIPAMVEYNDKLFEKL